MSKSVLFSLMEYVRVPGIRISLWYRALMGEEPLISSGTVRLPRCIRWWLVTTRRAIPTLHLGRRSQASKAYLGRRHSTLTVLRGRQEISACLSLLPAPALFSDDFEAGAGEWTSVVNDEVGNTQWELGSPSGTSGPLTGADESGNAWSTNLGDYGQDSDVSLFSPPIDFGGLQGAELTFDAYRDADRFLVGTEVHGHFAAGR